MPKGKGEPRERLADTILTPSGFERSESELVFALVGAVGTDLGWVENALCDCLADVGYVSPARIRVSTFLSNLKLHDEAGKLIKLCDKPEDERIRTHMRAGNALRKGIKRGDALALMAIQKIMEAGQGEISRKAYVINSLKHANEVQTLRRIYGPGFFLIGVHSPVQVRERRLAEEIARTRGTADSKPYKKTAEELIAIDEFEPDEFGQQVRETFHLSDVFVSLRGDSSNAKDSARQALKRFVELILGNTFFTPMTDEYLMFHAYAASLRSGSLSRQVGAVIGTDRGEVISVGCNDVPRAEGGLYWPQDADDARDLTLDRDSSDEQKERIVKEILTSLAKNKWISSGKENSVALALELLKGTRLMDLIEFGRAAHAEMDALLAAGRVGAPIQGHILYSTTFPCHVCAKLIIAAGIKRVVYIEPYPKSLALELHSDAINIEGRNSDGGKKGKNRAKPVEFASFQGVGPRRYLDFFSLTTSTGGRVRRKDTDGKKVSWNPKNAKPRTPLLPTSYLEREKQASEVIDSALKLMKRN